MRNSGPSSQPFGDGSPSCALVSALWVAQLKGQIAPLGDSIESIDERGWLNLACRRRSGRSASGLRSGPAGCRHARPPSGTRSSRSTCRALSARSATFRSWWWMSSITSGTLRRLVTAWRARHGTHTGARLTPDQEQGSPVRQLHANYRHCRPSCTAWCRPGINSPGTGELRDEAAYYEWSNLTGGKRSQDQIPAGRWAVAQVAMRTPNRSPSKSKAGGLKFEPLAVH